MNVDIFVENSKLKKTFFSENVNVHKFLLSILTKTLNLEYLMKEKSSKLLSHD